MQKKYEPGTPEHKIALVTGVIVDVTLKLILIGLMLWAASETTGFLHWALLVWVGQFVLVYVLVTAKRSIEKEVTR